MENGPDTDAAQYDGQGPGRQRRLSRRAILAMIPAISSVGVSSAVAAPEGPSSFLADIVAVPDGRSARLADGRIVVLPHILPPGLDRHAPMGDTNPLRVAARALADRVLARRVRIDLETPGLDRHGRLRARISVGGRDIGIELATGGFARVFPEPGADPARIMELIAAEDRAREQNTGFWETGLFALVAAEPYGGGADRFEIVSGHPVAVTRIGRRDHLEFGEDWRTDFTVGLGRRVVRDLAGQGIPREALIGRAMTLRGWVRIWNGPFMEVDEISRLTVHVESDPA